jgi:hypothetical protein
LLAEKLGEIEFLERRQQMLRDHVLQPLAPDFVPADEA